MKHTLAVFLLSIITALADITPIVQWDIETGRLVPVPYAISIRRGESVYLEPRFVNYSAAINLAGATVQMRYSPDNTMASYYAVTGSLMATTGRVHIGWADYLNPTNDALYYEIRATAGTNVLARSYGTLTLLWGIGGVNTGLTARTSINWPTVDQAGGNAILDNGAAWIAVSNAAFSGGTGSDSVTNVTGGLLTLTDKQIGLTAGVVSQAVAGVYQPAGTYLVPADTNGAEWGSHTGFAGQTNGYGNIVTYNADAFAPSGTVSGTTYTFANTNLVAGVVYTNGTVVWIGTNAPAFSDDKAWTNRALQADLVAVSNVAAGAVQKIETLTNWIVVTDAGIVGEPSNPDAWGIYAYPGGTNLHGWMALTDANVISDPTETWGYTYQGTFPTNSTPIQQTLATGTVRIAYLTVTNFTTNPQTGEGRFFGSVSGSVISATGSMDLNGVSVLTNITTAAIAAAGVVTTGQWLSAVSASNLLPLVVNQTCNVPYRADAPATDQQWRMAQTQAVVLAMGAFDTNTAWALPLSWNTAGYQLTYCACTIRTNTGTMRTNAVNLLIASRPAGATNWTVTVTP
jgi:hypothetical protein